ncbi:unnamed protein product, partial [Didymodactylos carnosus]
SHMMTINDLYDDLWLEIFEFLYINEIFHSFWNINSNVNRLITDHRQKLHAFMISEESQDYFNLTILPNIHSDQLILLKLKYCYKNQINLYEFKNLQSLTLFNIDSTRLKSLFMQKQSIKLKYLCFNVLIVDNKDKSKILKSLLKMTTLKTCQFNFIAGKIGLTGKNIISSSILSNIENLITESDFVTTSLFKLIPHLPKLHYLNIHLQCDDRYKSDITLNSLLNLKILKLYLSHVSFNHLKLLFKSVCSNLQILMLNGWITNDLQYLSSENWINIFKLLKNLQKFKINLTYHTWRRLTTEDNKIVSKCGDLISL